MIKTKINMIGGGFQHDVCSSALNKNKYIEWSKDNSANISIHIDQGLFYPTNKNKLNFGWIAESSSIIPEIINQTKNNINQLKENFKYIFTHDERIINIDSDFFKFTLPNALPWIQNKKIYKKNQLCSFIVSNKNWTSGHKFRLEILNKYKEKIDHYGRGFPNELPWSYIENGVEESGKLLALKNYFFSFAFENDNYQSIFCEKITDCFATGTIPIFWGTPNISNFFDKEGIIIFDEDFDFSKLTEEFYHSKKINIENNLQQCIDLDSSEDYIFLNYIK
jgi:hypothetical protein